MDVSHLHPWTLQAPRAPVESGAKRPVGVEGAQFEQLLLRQWLQQVRHASLEDRRGSVSAGYLELADDHLAAMLAAGGGLGIGASVNRWVRGLEAYRDAAR